MMLPPDRDRDAEHWLPPATSFEAELPRGSSFEAEKHARGDQVFGDQDDDEEELDALVDDRAEDLVQLGDEVHEDDALARIEEARQDSSRPRERRGTAGASRIREASGERANLLAPVRMSAADLDRRPYYEMEFDVPDDTWRELMRAIDMLKSEKESTILAGAQKLQQLLDTGDANAGFFDPIVQRSIVPLRALGYTGNRAVDSRVRACIARIEEISGQMLEDLIGDEERRRAWIQDDWDGRTPHRQHVSQVQQRIAQARHFQRWRRRVALGITLLLGITAIFSLVGLCLGLINFSETVSESNGCNIVVYVRAGIALWVALSLPALAAALNFLSFEEPGWGRVKNPINSGPVLRISFTLVVNLLAVAEFSYKVYRGRARISLGSSSVICDEEFFVNGPYLALLYVVDAGVAISLFMRWIPPDLQVRQPTFVQTCWVPSLSLWHARGFTSCRCCKPLFANVDALRKHVRAAPADIVLQAELVRTQSRDRDVVNAGLPRTPKLDPRLAQRVFEYIEMSRVLEAIDAAEERY